MTALPSNYHRQHLNETFGNLTITSFAFYRNRQSFWVYKCTCGKEKIMSYAYRNRKKYTDCGKCLSLDKKKEAKNNKSFCKISNKHGLSGTKIYRLYSYIKERCYNPNSGSWEWYGARGIRMCDEWLKNPSSFVSWALSNGYEEGLLIDRMDVNGNYQPSNCRFVDDKTSCRNVRTNIKAEIQGETKLFIEWCEQLNLNYSAVYQKFIYPKRMSPSDAITHALIFPCEKYFTNNDAFELAVSTVIGNKDILIKKYAPTLIKFQQ